MESDDGIILQSKIIRIITRYYIKNNSDFYYLNCLDSCRIKNKLELHKRVCENKDFRNVIMPFEDTEILEFNQYQKSHKVPFIINVDLEYTIEKTNGCKNNPENSSATKVSKHILSGFSRSTISSFDI